MIITLYSDINVDFSVRKHIVINAKQYDSSSRFVRVRCMNNGEPIFVNSEEYSVFVRYKKPDEHVVVNECNVSVDGRIVFEITEQMLSVCGTCYVDLVICDGNGSSVSTMNFMVNVIKCPVESSDVESSDEIDALSDIISQLNTMELETTDIDFNTEWE